MTGESRPGEADPVVVQVSRWDKLKDMPGVMRGFAKYVAPAGDGYLMLAGPEVSGVTDDPEGAGVLADCLALWGSLPAATRARILLVTLPLDDTFGRGQEPRGQLGHRGLAGPVRTGQHCDLATAKLEILVLEHGRFRPVRERRVDKSAHTRNGV